MVNGQSAELSRVLEFLNRRAGSWLAYMGFCAVETLLALLALSGAMMGILAVDPRWSPVMAAVPLIVFRLMRPAARRRKLRLVEAYRAERGGGPADTEPAASGIPARGRLRGLALEGLVLLPFLLAATGLTWGAPVPLRWFALASAYTVGWGFARGALAPLFDLLRAERSMPTLAAGAAAPGGSVSQQVP